MSSKLTESAIEYFAIKLFECLGYDCIHAPDGDNILSKLMSGEVRVGLVPDTQDRKYKRTNVAG